MRKALLGLALLVPALAACGGGSSSPTAATAPASAAATQAGPSPEQFTQAKDLAAKLGCPNVDPTPAGGVSNGGVEAECKAAPKPGDEYADVFTSYTRRILVFHNPDELNAYLTQARGFFDLKGVQGDSWTVSTDADEDAARIKQAVGGTSL
jgi:hypothetical protein